MFKQSKAEPRIPKDGKCVVDGKPLLEIKRYGAGHEDAFCSTTCCRKYFGTQTAIDLTIETGISKK